MLKGVCCLFQSACCALSQLSLSPFQDVSESLFKWFCSRQDLYPRYSWRHLFSATFILFFGAPGQNRTSPHWVTEGRLWAGQRALPTPWPLHYGSCLLPSQRWELNNWTSVLVTLYFSLCSYNLPCGLYVIPVFHNSFKRLYVQTVVLS